jgi:hypothetical protein
MLPKVHVSLLKNMNDDIHNIKIMLYNIAWHEFFIYGNNICNTIVPHKITPFAQSIQNISKSSNKITHLIYELEKCKSSMKYDGNHDTNNVLHHITK